MDSLTASSAYACEECRSLMSRRRFLQAAATVAAAPSLAWISRVAYAQDHASNRDILVHIFLRGGADGLTLVVPHGDPHYYKYRPTQAIPRPDSHEPTRCTDLDGFFGFSPGMSALLPAYRAGHLLPIHACGSQDPSRSHFDAQRYMEVGKPGDPNLLTGWLGRSLASSPPVMPTAPMRAVGFEPAIPQTLEGGPHTIPIPDPSTFQFVGSSAVATALHKAYTRYGDPMKSAVDTTFKTLSRLHSIQIGEYKPTGGAVYPNSEFGAALRSAAALIKAEVGIESLYVDYEGWDTHSKQGSTNGELFHRMQNFSRGLAAFHTDIFSGNVTNVTVVVLTEFGRVVRENASKGTDHGHGTAIFLMGKNITGGRVLAKWPGLADGQLYDNQDLMVTMDYRDILAEVVKNRLGNTNLDQVFPGYTPTFHGVTKA